MVVVLYGGVILIGLSVGGFLNVVIARLPEHRSVVRPGSQCLSCQRMLTWLDKLPLIGFAACKGRCRTCRARISRAYPIIEALTAGVFAALIFTFGPTPSAVTHALLAAVLIVASETDRRGGVIPNPLVMMGSGLGVGAVGFEGVGLLVEHLVAAIVTMAGLVVLRRTGVLVFGRAGLGMGDVKLGGLIGLFVGWDVWWIVYLAAVLGMAVGMVSLMAGRIGWSARLPFAPFLAVATGLHVWILPMERLVAVLGEGP